MPDQPRERKLVLRCGLLVCAAAVRAMLGLFVCGFHSVWFAAHRARRAPTGRRLLRCAFGSHTMRYAMQDEGMQHDPCDLQHPSTAQQPPLDYTLAAEAEWAHSSGSHSVQLGFGCLGAPALVAARVAADGGRAAAHGTAAARSGRAVAVVDYALGRTRGDDLRTT